MISALIVTSLVALQLGTPTVNLSPSCLGSKPRELRVPIILPSSISMPVYLSTYALSKASSTFG